MAGTRQKQDEAEAAEAAAAADAEEAPDETTEPTTYHKDRLTTDADPFFGVPSHVVAGALSHAKVGNKANFSLDEMKQMIAAFLDHEVEMEGVA